MGQNEALQLYRREQDDGSLRLVLAGLFDASGAARLAELLDELAHVPVTVEFSSRCEPLDVGVGRLAQELARRGLDDVRVLGLRAHSERILRAFGRTTRAA